MARTPSTLQEAVWELMNNPHPLDILGDPGAYGDRGAISRFHNPDNYTRAIGGALRSRGAPWRRLVDNAKKAGVTFNPPALGVPPLADDNAPPGSPGGKAHLPPARPAGARHV
jgi:hypothetical protein